MASIHRIGDVTILNGKHDTVWITRRSMVSGRLQTMNMAGVTADQIAAFVSGTDRRLVQDAFPHLSNSEREFLITGITQEEWTAAFPPEEEVGDGE